MARLTTLAAALGRLGKLNEDATIYAAEPWTPESAAIVAMEPDDGSLPRAARANGLVYFLEVAVALDFVEGWEASLPSPSTAEERCTRLIQYATDDA